MERAGYKGTYHVLHGIIDPLNGVGPEELYIDDLLSRIGVLLTTVDALSDSLIEVILAVSTSLEGESTSLYISRLVRGRFPGEKVRITRLARGLPVGGDVEYADEVTLAKALEGRIAF
jgi:recombination protein RecR